MSASLDSGPDHTPDAKIAIPDVKNPFGGFQDQFNGQSLLADMNGSNPRCGGDAGGGAEADQHSGQAPIAFFSASAMGGELFADVAMGAKAFGRSVQQLGRQVWAAPLAQEQQSRGELAEALL